MYTLIKYIIREFQASILQYKLFMKSEKCRTLLWDSNIVLTVFIMFIIKSVKKYVSVTLYMLHSGTYNKKNRKRRRPRFIEFSFIAFFQF